MKILLVSNLYPPNAIGGYERLCATIASALARRGHEIAVLTSDYGSVRPEHEEMPVERSLKLLVGRDGIYLPFDGTPQEREKINRHNCACVRRAIERQDPDAVLVGNLYFFDRSILDGLGRAAGRTVFLLTDIYMVHFADDRFLQSFFREHVLHPEPGREPLVPADPPGLALEGLGPGAGYEQPAAMAPELARRRRMEAELAGGRAVFQVRGTCHLCGDTSFVVSTAGPATAMLPERREPYATCARCGLDGTVRGAVHVLDILAAPDDDARVLVTVRDPVALRVLTERFPRCTAVASLADGLQLRRADGPGRRFQHAVILEPADDARDAQQKLHRLEGALDPGGRVVLGGEFLVGRGVRSAAAGSCDRAAEILGRASDVGLGEPRAYAYWSSHLGYLGLDHLVCTARQVA